MSTPQNELISIQLRKATPYEAKLMNAYSSLAKQTVEEFVKTGRLISLPADLPAKMLKERAGVFVSIRKKNGSLRGCIGTYRSTQSNIAQEILHNAMAAAAHDPRFPPISPAELPDLVYAVDLLSKPENASKEELDPKKYGLIVQAADGRRGLLLPDLEGVVTIDQQISICRQKALICEDEPVRLYRFTVERHK